MTRSICLVIPARNAGATLRLTLPAIVPLIKSGQVARAIVVDDGSQDDTAEVAESFGLECIRSAPRGRSAARNLGWRAATQEIVWFLDADCVPAPETLARLLPHYDAADVGGVGGSFALGETAALLPRLIHEEILQRHGVMGPRVNFLATGNASYRRAVLEAVNGFDEGFIRSQDAELSYRVRSAGYALAFEPTSRVEHFHDTRLRDYFRAQRQQGFWRVFLHARHKRQAAGDSYSSLLDNLQPPVAVLVLLSLPACAFPVGPAITAALAGLLMLMPIPMGWRIARRTGRWTDLAYVPFSAVRAFARGIGVCLGFAALLVGGAKEHPRPATEPRPVNTGIDTS